MLARLALAAGGTVSDDALREAVWPRSVPASASKTLAGYVHRLRHALGPEVIARRPNGYGVVLEHVELDVVGLDDDVAAARRAAMSGDDESAVAAYRHALQPRPWAPVR